MCCATNLTDLFPQATPEATWPQLLTPILQQAFTQAGFTDALVEVKKSDRPDLCQFQCNNALSLAKTYHQSPVQIAQAVVQQLEQSPKMSMVFSQIAVVNPGFINLSLQDTLLTQKIALFWRNPQLNLPKLSSKKVIIDFGSPNVAKNMHIGHLRSTILGDCLCRLGRLLGLEVIGDNHIGDWGTQMGMLICGLQGKQPELVYFQPDYDGEYPDKSPVTMRELETLYPEISARCKEDEELHAKAMRATAELHQGRRGYVALWQHFLQVSLVALKEDFAKLNVYFDSWKGESYAEQFIPEVLQILDEAHLTKVSQGALIVELPPELNPNNEAPMMVQKSDGTSNYATTDLATILDRVRNTHADEIYYVVDQRQSLHFINVFYAAQASGMATGVKLEHVGFGTINGKDGKPFKTRAGGTVKLGSFLEMVEEVASQKVGQIENANMSEKERTDIIHCISLATIRFADLINYRLTNYIFDIERFSQFEGKTGPYLLYTLVRLRSLLAKVTGDTENFHITINSEVERQLLLMLNELGNILLLTWEKKSPNILAEYTFELAQTFSKFYTAYNISHEQDTELYQSRCQLSRLVEHALSLLVSLMGMPVPDRM